MTRPTHPNECSLGSDALHPFDPQPQANSRLEAALRYAALGYWVFPCRPHQKRPLTRHGFKDATTDAAQIRRWWTDCPEANLAIATEGLLVLDVDAASDWLRDDSHPIHQVEAPCALSARGGRHYFFRQPPGKSWRNTASKLAPCVDTRANGGYIVVSPSELEDGRRYRWSDFALDVPREQLPEPPDWLQEALERRLERPTPPEAPPRVIGAKVIPEGQRNDSLTRTAGRMRRVGMTVVEIASALRAINERRCRPPLPDQEVFGVARSVARYPVGPEFSGASSDSPVRPEINFAVLTSKELKSNLYELEYLVDGLLVHGQPGVIAGPKKSLKTNLSIDLALSLASGHPFLGAFTVNRKARVCLMSGESGRPTIRETALRIAAAKGLDLDDLANVVWSFDVPQLDSGPYLDALRRLIQEHKTEVLVLDPTYLMLGAVGDRAGNLFAVGALLRSLGELAQEGGCTVILCHHLRKNIPNAHEPADLEAIAWAGFQEFMRQWVLISRRVPYDPGRGGHHELWMHAGGSAGHSGLWGVNVDEGTRQDDGGRRWEVEVIPHEQALEEQQAARRTRNGARLSKKQGEVLEHLKTKPEGDTRNGMRAALGMNGDAMRDVLGVLEDEGLIVECAVEKHGRTETGYRLAELDAA